ncbi:hypothetical protein CVT26_004782 [Gymnopilus dilepis]|uniref:Uncharacterized protein n=1 Tax=Gymnopilus dilepis TaxID=231916 RepID=A0A409XZD6_9AGAR|nr:hypothetical protein CVT26_004782 [Gymnopilus dilepis]
MPLKVSLVGNQVNDAHNESGVPFSQHRSVETSVSRAERKSVFRIGELPLELISYIFELYVLDREEKSDDTRATTEATPFTTPSPLVLILVCKSWHRIAERTPGLWTEIYYYFVDEAEAEAEFHAQCFKTWLRLSGKLPLFLCFWADQDTDLETAPFMSLINEVNSCSHRWGDLRLLDLPAYFYPLFTGNDRGAPCLDHLELLSQFGYKYQGAFRLTGKKPAPRNFEISYIYLRNIQVDFSAVTRITAWHVASEDVIEMICLSPLLEELDWQDGELYDQDADALEVPTPRPVVSQTLKRLYLMAGKGGEEDCLRIFKKLTLPALQYFSCDSEFFHKEGSYQSLAPFFDRSRCPLVEIHLRCAPLSKSGLVTLFTLLPAVQKASIWIQSRYIGQGMDSFYHSLLHDTDPVLLPCLTSLGITVDPAFKWSQLPYFVYYDVKTLTRKRPLTSLNIACNFSDGKLPNYLDKDDLGLVRWLSGRGISVSIEDRSPMLVGNTWDLIALSEEKLARGMGSSTSNQVGVIKA